MWWGQGAQAQDSTYDTRVQSESDFQMTYVSFDSATITFRIEYYLIDDGGVQWGSRRRLLHYLTTSSRRPQILDRGGQSPWEGNKKCVKLAEASRNGYWVDWFKGVASVGYLFDWLLWPPQQVTSYGPTTLLL